MVSLSANFTITLRGIHRTLNFIYFVRVATCNVMAVFILVSVSNVKAEFVCGIIEEAREQTQ